MMTADESLSENLNVYQVVSFVCLKCSRMATYRISVVVLGSRIVGNRPRVKADRNDFFNLAYGIRDFPVV